ncbi:hypothetical protein AgCh_032013 [Apium graveolens]
MWVLKDRPMNEFYWEEKTSFFPTSEYMKARVSGIRNNGKVILEGDDKLISYNLDNHVVSDLAGYDEGPPNLGFMSFSGISFCLILIELTENKYKARNLVSGCEFL